jgi:hypothetical protein
MSDPKNQDKNKDKVQDKPKEELKPPTRLKIKLKTNVPGFGEINYNPAKMTLTRAGEDDSNIFFNPLIKLSTNAVNRAPESIRQLQFCNKGYFASLINSLNQTPAKNLVEATNKGYIRNNIDITLRTLFPPESVIKLGGKKYTIAAVDSDSDEWHIDVKVRLEDIIDRDKITDPRMAAYIAASDRPNADRELAALRRAGIAAGIGVQAPAPVPVPVPAAKLETGSISKPLAITDKAIDDKKPLAITNEVKPKPLAIADKPITEEIAPRPEAEAEVEDVTPLLLQEGKPQVIEFKKVPFSGRNTRILDPNGPATARFRTTLEQLYNMVNSVYVYSGQNYRNKLAPPGTNVAISPKRWADSINRLYVKQTVTDGDCFFDAISCAINQYNSQLPDNNITETIYIRESDISGKNSNIIYGITNDFNIQSLRTTVYRYIVKNGPIKEQMFRVSAMSVDEANDEIARRCDATNPPNFVDYTNWVRNELSMRAGDGIIYNAPFALDSETPDKFRAAYAGSKDIYKRPFVSLDDQRLQGYIESTRYWADTIAIRAMAEMLNICAIPIRVLTRDTVDDQNKTWDDYSNEDPQPAAVPNLIPLISIPIALDNYVVDQVRTPRPNKIRSVKYIFLSETGSHYDLITFGGNLGGNVGGVFAFNSSNMIDSIPLYIKMVIFSALFAKNFISDQPIPEWVPLQEDMYYILISVFVILNRGPLQAQFCAALDANFSSKSLLQIAKNQNMCARLQNAYMEKSKRPSRTDSIGKRIELFGVMYNETLREVTERFNSGNVPAGFKPKEKKGQPIARRPVTRNKPEEPKVGGQYPPQYPNQYPPQQMLAPGRDMRDLFKRDSESSLAYYITIYMYLYPGTNPPPGKLRSLKCAARRFKISQILSKMAGAAPPSIMPEYSYSRPELFDNNNKKSETRKGGRTTHPNKRRTRRLRPNKRETRKRGRGAEAKRATRRRK